LKTILQQFIICLIVIKSKKSEISLQIEVLKVLIKLKRLTQAEICKYINIKEHLFVFMITKN